MELLEVSGKETIRLFHKVPEILYKNDPNYIPAVASAN
jgi:hypothetical protein